MTDELKKLYQEYHNLFGVTPSFYEELEYSQRSYNDYARDIKKAIKEHKELPEAIGFYDEFDTENDDF